MSGSPNFVLFPSSAWDYTVAFPMGQDSATLWDKGTEVPSLSRDNGTSSKSCHRIGQAGRDNLSKSGTGHKTGQSLFFCQYPGQDTGRDRTITNSFYDFLIFGESEMSWDVLGQWSLSKDVCSCPCLGTKGHGNIFVLGQRDNGTSHPGLSQDVCGTFRPMEMLLYSI